jgi:hypothetical protein
MNKQEAILRWESACRNPGNLQHRWISVKRQYNRNQFELDDSLGRMRIVCGASGDYIKVFHTILYGDSQKEPEATFELTPCQYRDLKEMFFGDIEEDREYLKKIGAV